MKRRLFFVIAHNIRSLHNVGAIFRTADAFGVSKLFLTGYTGSPPDGKISKVALGAELTVPWEQRRLVRTVVDGLKKAYPGIEVVGLENNADVGLPVHSIRRYRVKGPCVLILGEETKGIPKPVLRLCDVLVEIPMLGQKESLNVSVAFGIAAYALAV